MCCINPISKDTTTETNSPGSTSTSCWSGRSICTLGRLSWMFGIALIATGVVLLILDAFLIGEFSFIGSMTAWVGVAVVSMGLLTNCCQGVCNRVLEEANNKDKKTTTKTVKQNPIPLTTSTKEFFESKGLFGVSPELIRELDRWRQMRHGKNIKITDAGFILHGSPGTGKTTIARAIAELLGGEYREKTCGGLKNKLFGGSEELMDKLLTVPEHSFCVVTIDEITGIFPKRGGFNSNTDSLVEHILGTLSAREQNPPRYLLIGATNNFSQLDEALVRPGRLGKAFEISKPNDAVRQQIFEYHLSKLQKEEKLDPEVDWKKLASTLAKATANRSCSDIDALMGDAEAAASIEDRKISLQDFRDALKSLKKP